MKIKEEIEKLLIGIDKTGVESPDAWWETSTGAEFGKQKLQELLTLIELRLEAGENLKCCGNCFMASSEDWCAEDVGGYCDKWTTDGMTREKREVRNES